MKCSEIDYMEKHIFLSDKVTDLLPLLYAEQSCFLSCEVTPQKPIMNQGNP